MGSNPSRELNLATWISAGLTLGLGLVGAWFTFGQTDQTILKETYGWALGWLTPWICAILGFLLITYVMFSGSRRLELRQDKNYGDDPVYQKYVKTVPIMIPLIPLYSVKNWKAFVA